LHEWPFSIYNVAWFSLFLYHSNGYVAWSFFSWNQVFVHQPLKRTNKKDPFLVQLAKAISFSASSSSRWSAIQQQQPIRKNALRAPATCHLIGEPFSVSTIDLVQLDESFEVTIDATAETINAFPTLMLSDGTLLHASNDFHNSSWHDDVAVAGVDEHGAEQTWYATVLYFLFVNDEPSAVVHYYKEAMRDGTAYSHPFIKAKILQRETYNIISIDCIHRRVHIVPKFDEDGYFFMNDYVFR
jgi:hypothetical protein